MILFLRQALAFTEIFSATTRYPDTNILFPKK